jgi:regulator of sigma E protease
VFVTTILSAILVLGILVFVHELGHFLVAKSVGIRVLRFSLGFPPKLISFRKGETEYCISVIPLGGYVKMAGEDPDESENVGAPYEFMSKTPLQRSAVILAGPVMNYITAIVLFAAIFAIQGYQVFHDDKMVVGTVAEDSPAESAGLAVDDVILSIDGEPITDFFRMAEIVSARAEEDMSVEYQRGNTIDTVSLITTVDTVRNQRGEDVVVGRIGLAQKVWWEKPGFLGSVELAFRRTWEITVLLVGFLWKFITLQVSLKEIGGPLFIAQVSGEVAKLGFAALFSFVAMLSINLAIINILPIPVLDGGHLVFLAIEVVRRKPLTMKQRVAVQQVGLAFLLMLIVVVTYNDIARIFIN